jgi:hypothetical protein
VVVYSAIRDDEYVMMSDMHFFISVAGLTAAGILILEGLRALKRGKGA